MKLTEIQDLIDFVSKSGVSEVDIQQKDFRIIIKAEDHSASASPMVVQASAPQVQAPAPAAQVTPSAPAPAPAAEEAPAPAAEEANYITVKSPMIGTFYRKPSPDKPTFVEVGDTIKEGDVLCIIEAMKLFNEIESEVSGKIVKVLVDDTSPVEYDQPLFLVEPA